MAGAELFRRERNFLAGAELFLAGAELFWRELNFFGVLPLLIFNLKMVLVKVISTKIVGNLRSKVRHLFISYR